MEGFLNNSRKCLWCINLPTIVKTVSAGALWGSKLYFSAWLKESYSNTTPLSCQIKGYPVETRSFQLETDESNSDLIDQRQTWSQLKNRGFEDLQQLTCVKKGKYFCQKFRLKDSHEITTTATLEKKYQSAVWKGGGKKIRHYPSRKYFSDFSPFLALSLNPSASPFTLSALTLYRKLHNSNK